MLRKPDKPENSKGEKHVLFGKKFAFSGLILLLIIMIFAACNAPAATQSPTDGSVGLTGTVTVAGSTTVQPLAERFAEAFTAINPYVRITVQGGGSSVGVKAAAEGSVDIGMASRKIKDSELADSPNLKVIVIAQDGIAIIANPSQTASNLTVEQVRQIFSGQITNWSQVGGEDLSILVVSREEGSGTRGAFEELVMSDEDLITDMAILLQSNGAIRTTVSTTPTAIGYISFGYLDEAVKPLSIEGIEPTEPNAANGSYAIVRPLNMLSDGEPEGIVKSWLEWILSAEGQTIVRDDGFIPVK